MKYKNLTFVEYLIFCVFALTFLSILGTVVWSVAIPFTTLDTIEAKVVSAESKMYGNGNNARSIYLIYTENETFSNEDCWVRFKFNSSDFHGKIRPNHTYKFKVIGYRVPFLSWYRNVIAAELIETSTSN